MITKTGRTLRDDFNQLRSVGEWITKRRKGTKGLAQKAYGVVKGIGGVGASAANRAADFAVKNPRSALTLGAATTYAGYKLPGNITKGMAHVDPNQHYTYATPFGHRIDSANSNPVTKKYIQAQNRFF